jgi:hypothetical protein
VRKRPLSLVIRRAAIAVCALLLLAAGDRASAQETAAVLLRPDIEFASQAARFQPIGENYATPELPAPPPTPPQSPPSYSPIPSPPSTPPAPPSSATPIERYEYDSVTEETEAYIPAPIVEPSDCDSSTVYGGTSYGVRARQIPDNWLWGCNGSAYRTGPGTCDDWQVGCRWETSVDGMMLFREDANLDRLRSGLIDSGALVSDPIVYDQFDYAPGGRVSFIGRFPRWAGYEVQAAYEGIEEWNATIVQEKIALPGNAVPPFPPDSIEQSSLFYRSSLQSAELNVLRRFSAADRWFGGVRYIRFVDEINSFVEQEAPSPIPPDTTGTIADRHMLNDLNNNLIGFQIGGRHDLWQPLRRFTIEGSVNAGVYYNHIKRTDTMSVTTTEFTPEAVMGDPTVVNTTNLTNNVVSEPSNIAYVCEASLTGVCRLNNCWTCRTGYQILWIDGLSLAQDAFLDTGVGTRDLMFQGWHFGVECRR